MTTPLTYRHKMTLFRLGDDWIEVKGTRYPLDGVTAQIQGTKGLFSAPSIVIAGPGFSYSGTLTGKTSSTARRFAAQVTARAQQVQVRAQAQALAQEIARNITQEGK